MIPLPFTLLFWVWVYTLFCVSCLESILSDLLEGWFGGAEFSQLLLVYKALISPSYLNEILAGYSNLGCRFFSFITLSTSCHSLLAWRVSMEKQQITHKGIAIKITADLSIETLQARREWQDTLKVMKENNLQPRLLYPARIWFKYEEEIKNFPDKQKLREFSTTKPALQQMLKDLL